MGGTSSKDDSFTSYSSSSAEQSIVEDDNPNLDIKKHTNAKSENENEERETFVTFHKITSIKESNSPKGKKESEILESVDVDNDTINTNFVLKNLCQNQNYQKKAPSIEDDLNTVAITNFTREIREG